MRNVWFLPSCDTLISWLKRCGFKNIRLVDVTVTSIGRTANYRMDDFSFAERFFWMRKTATDLRRLARFRNGQLLLPMWRRLE